MASGSSSFPQPASETIVENGEVNAQETAVTRDSQEDTLREPSSPGHTTSEKRNSDLLNPIERGSPGDGIVADPETTGPDASRNAPAPTQTRTSAEIMEAKLKSRYYGELFAYREPTITAKDQITQDSAVTAEVMTNLIIDDEYSFMTTFSSFLSQRYTRPQSSIMISLRHTACLSLGGSFEPAYHVTISALPMFVQSTTNKRNAALIQNFLATELKIPAERGVVRFHPVAEECLAMGGVTVRSALDSFARANGGATADSDKSRGEDGSGGGRGGGVVGLGRRMTRRNKANRQSTLAAAAVPDVPRTPTSATSTGHTPLLNPTTPDSPSFLSTSRKSSVAGLDASGALRSPSLKATSPGLPPPSAALATVDGNKQSRPTSGTPSRRDSLRQQQQGPSKSAAAARERGLVLQPGIPEDASSPVGGIGGTGATKRPKSVKSKIKNKSNDRTTVEMKAAATIEGYESPDSLADAAIMMAPAPLAPLQKGRKMGISKRRSFMQMFGRSG